MQTATFWRNAEGIAFNLNRGTLENHLGYSARDVYRCAPPEHGALTGDEAAAAAAAAFTYYLIYERANRTSRTPRVRFYVKT